MGSAQDEMSGHGFRAMAWTILEEVPRCRAWADYLDKLKNGADVMPILKAG
ncbi:MAG: hypothetical protein WA642_08295 [Steroidobacteraceae bacterium]